MTELSLFGTHLPLVDDGWSEGKTGFSTCCSGILLITYPWHLEGFHLSKVWGWFKARRTTLCPKVVSPPSCCLISRFIPIKHVFAGRQVKSIAQLFMQANSFWCAEDPWLEKINIWESGNGNEVGAPPLRDSKRSQYKWTLPPKGWPKPYRQNSRKTLSYEISNLTTREGDNALTRCYYFVFSPPAMRPLNKLFRLLQWLVSQK